MIYPYRQDDQHLVKDLHCSLSALIAWQRCSFLFIPALLILNIMLFCISPETLDTVIVHFPEDDFKSTSILCSLYDFSIFILVLFKFLMIQLSIVINFIFQRLLKKSNQKSFIFDAITIFKSLDYGADAHILSNLRNV